MIKKLQAIIVILIIYSCATVQAPTGGERDEKAPILYESNPEDQSTNFNKQELTLYFNEWMKLDQIQKELIITPRVEIEYEATLKKQELLIELKEPLKDSTTYTFNFRKALSDITEGNLWENPKIAFSTGPFLDSLAVIGTIYDLMENKVVPNYLVGLYSAKVDTANLRQGKPIYFTTTNENGEFNMQNIKAGDYRLYAFDDKNDNLINDSRIEPFGFHDSIIKLNDSISPIAINTYKRNEDTLTLKKYSPVGKDFVIQYNKGIQYYKIINPKSPKEYIYGNNIDESASLKIFKENFPNQNTETDSIKLIVDVTDSIGTTLKDTIYFQTRDSRITNDTIKIEKEPKKVIDYGLQTFTVGLSKPVKQINPDSIQIRIDSTIVYNIDQNNINYNFNRKLITLTIDLNKEKLNAFNDSLYQVRQQQKLDSIENNTDTIQNKNITKSQSEKETTERPTLRNINLYFGKSAFIGIENDSTSKKEIKLTFREPEDYGIIQGKVIGADFPFVIELLNKEYEVVDTIANKTEFEFNYILPGDYSLRLLKDLNNNQRWDAGNPLLLKKSEEYIYHNEVIPLKPNWIQIDKNFNLNVDNEVDNDEDK
ncbi:Ig-like domain-containing domain [Marivirga sp.]|uniref:Ig-like domain-containing domain n=1 Tax=Marivirga sp. TaxID=2018662 RepID=UPI002D7FAF7B|nr:Ig-like domain-containing domain [Marivirga sp.]HET8858463.1 Ig-like domain-containing domain [Marivirga sp.]